MKADESKQECGCPWDMDKGRCPHCNRNILYNGELRNRHMPRCHNERENAA